MNNYVTLAMDQLLKAQSHLLYAANATDAAMLEDKLTQALTRILNATEDIRNAKRHFGASK